MHHIYTTPGFIIHSTPHGEAGKFILIFTRDFGLVGAIAQGIRLNQSKLRYHLQDFNFSTVSLVRGKEVWRITGAHEMKHEQATEVHFKILKILRRLLQGEEKNEKLFEVLEQLYITNVSGMSQESVEILIVLRILNTLGYIRSNEQIGVFLESTTIDSSILEKAAALRKTIITIINTSLKESQL